MAYKAILPVGEYKKGDIVPDDQAEVWLKVYGIPHVEKCEAEEAPKVELKKKDDEVEETPNVDSWLDDYLARNEWVVKKAISGDKNTKKTLKKLLALEEIGKNRKRVLNEINKQLEE